MPGDQKMPSDQEPKDSETETADDLSLEHLAVLALQEVLRDNERAQRPRSSEQERSSRSRSVQIRPGYLKGLLNT